VFAVGASNTLAYHVAQTAISVNLATCEASGIFSFFSLPHPKKKKNLLKIYVDLPSLSLSPTCAQTVCVAVKLNGLSTYGVFIHALLMIGAWLWLVPCGILVAKFKSVFGPAWIKLHMPFQVHIYIYTCMSAVHLYMQLMHEFMPFVSFFFLCIFLHLCC
jgi:hypothetical protein